MSKWTIQELMKQAGCEKWPIHWNDIMDVAMNDFDQNGCPQATAEYYEKLAQKYGMLEDCLSLYQQAAAQIAQDEALSRLMVFLCKALQDREHISKRKGRTDCASQRNAFT